MPRHKSLLICSSFSPRHRSSVANTRLQSTDNFRVAEPVGCQVAGSLDEPLLLHKLLRVEPARALKVAGASVRVQTVPRLISVHQNFSCASGWHAQRVTVLEESGQPVAREV